MAARYIDADTHIVEEPEVWDMLASGEEEYKPGVVHTEADKASPGVFPTGQYWLIDGELYGKGGQALINYVDGTRSFLNPEAELLKWMSSGLQPKLFIQASFWAWGRSPPGRN